MAGSLPESNPRQTLCDLPPAGDTDEASILAQTADYDHSAEQSVQQFDPQARYRIVERVGAGGFGVVFKAWDTQLERTVAIKVLRAGSGDESAAALLAEARTLAKLDHPAIVPVYDLGKTATGELLIVSKFIDGSDLRSWMKSQRMTSAQAAQCVATIAEALDYAHAQGIVHRDVKPGNILLTAAGEPVLTDFGLALHEHAIGTGNQLVGTPAYMSPEQARSEGHRVDGRSDIYSLGTVFYELLCGQRPFVTQHREELLDFIRNVEVRPPRQMNREIPRELERICLKALAKRASERYSTAADMATELRDFLVSERGPKELSAVPAALTATPDEPSAALPIVVPHGLRSFDEADADFFLHLLPGARDRDGVPESVGFWRRRIESVDPGEAFRVGVLLGPSGSGKSSLVRAGILPLVADEVEVVMVDAGSGGLEDRLRRRMARQMADEEAENLTLHELAVQIRRRGPVSGRSKLLIVIDQFEQWLSVNDGREHTVLAEALRQCDGVRLQTLLIVRDDFTLPITRFLEELEEPLLQNRNFAAIDRFSPQHAAKVLEAFGRAYRVWELEPSRENRRFIELAVQELSRSGALIPVQLAALAEIVKDQPWTEATLKQLGGVEGVAVRFLEERLVGHRSHPEIRAQLPLVRRLLEALLPGEGDNENIRGPAKTKSQLLATLHGEITPQRLDKLLALLDAEVRLITPVRGGPVDSSDSASQPEPAYQLTHDYLVPAIRVWLSASQRSTRTGRAHLRLKELSDAWNARPTPQRLPTLLEWLTVRTLVRPAEWSVPERRMMDTASQRIFGRMAAAAGLVLIAVAALWQWARYEAARGLVAQLLAADTSEVPSIVEQLGGYDAWTLAAAGLNAEEPATSESLQGPALRRRLHQQLALAPNDPRAAVFVAEHAADIPPEQLAHIARLLTPQRSAVSPVLWQRLKDDSPASAEQKLSTACLLGALGDDEPAWNDVASAIVRQLLATRPALLPHWLKHLHSQRNVLAPKALSLLSQEGTTLNASQRNLLVETVATLAADDPQSLALALESAEAADLPVLWSAVEPRASAVADAVAKRFQFRARPSLQEVEEPPSDELVLLVNKWSGSIERRWAYVAACPREEFDALAQRLKATGYAPLTLRSYVEQGQPIVAAAFDRSSRDCRWQFQLPAEEAIAAHEAAAGQWTLCDLSPEERGPSAAQTYSLLWERLSRQEPDSRIALGADNFRLEELQKQLEPRSYMLSRCSSMLAADGSIAYCALWRRRPEGETEGSHRSRYAYAFGELYPGMFLSDVRLHFIQPHVRDAYGPTAEWEQAQFELKQAVSQQAQQTARGNLLRYALAKNDASGALAVSSELPATAIVRVRRATAAARLGDVQTVKQAVADLTKNNAESPLVIQLQIRLAILERRFDDLPGYFRLLDKDGSEYATRLANSLALAAGIEADSEPLKKQVSQWRSEALARLRYVLESGAATVPHLLVFDPDFDALRSDGEFESLLARHGLNRRYDSVWQSDRHLQSRLVFDVSVAEHERLAKEYSNQGYAIVCLDACRDPANGQILLASSWGRAVSSNEDSPLVAQRLAQLAAARARLGQTDFLLDVFRGRHGRNARAALIDIASTWLPAAALIDLVESGGAHDVQREVLLALGRAAGRDLPPFVRQKMQGQIARLLPTAADASLLAAATWCARQWSLASEPGEASTLPASRSRNFYANSLGQTMVVLDPPDRFLMGSPPWEADRVEKDGGEQLHWRRIGRRYAIAATETTVAQFKEFQEDPRVKKAYAERPFVRTERYAPAPDCPQTSVRWFDAVRFCQWLSEHEKIPEADWCYPGVLDAPPEKWTFPDNLLDRRGYRLPTEAEWEFACRGGSGAAHSHGEDRGLLKQYAWYLANSDEQSHPVGRLMPNDYGLFDMLGNVHEWCQDLYGLYRLPPGSYLFLDRSDPRLSVGADDRRVLRGGSFETPARQIRCADRTLLSPDNNSYKLGFRITRTDSSEH